MSGSAASNLGYGNIYPNSNVNGTYVNKDNSNYSGGFGSNEIPGCPGVSGAKSNVDAAASYIPGMMKGGKKNKRRTTTMTTLGLKKKIKNITNKYKMSKSKRRNVSKKLKRIKKRIQATMSRALARSMGRSRSRGFAASGGRRRRVQKGGVYTQYMNNMPYTPNYALGGQLSAADSALASPPPLTLNKGACLDNYNHYTGTTFPSKGH